MCTNYRPTQRQLLRDVFGIEPPPDLDWKPETYRDYAAPIVRADADDRRDSVLASFGMVPRPESSIARRPELGRRTSTR
jgi:putative SOS response-associated peptidase YedK